MLQQTLRLFPLLALIGICSAEDIPVISGVFMPSNIAVDYGGAQAACVMHHSRLATLDEITTAFKNGYEYCKWGWIDDQRVAMLRLTPFLACAGFNVGILLRDCPDINSAFCASKSGSVSTVSIVSILNRPSSYENASLTCLKSSPTAKLATKEQILNNTGSLPNNTPAWYDWGVGQVQNGALMPIECHDNSNEKSAFCYNPSLADVIIRDDTKTIKKIIMGCLLALVFVILLLAAACMRGNRFVCCMGKSRTQPLDIPEAPVPNWNKTSIYRRISHANKDIMYDNFANMEKRPPAIRPEMNIYKVHYTNMAFDTTGEQ